MSKVLHVAGRLPRCQWARSSRSGKYSLKSRSKMIFPSFSLSLSLILQSLALTRFWTSRCWVSDIHEHCGIHTPQYVDDEGIEIRPNEIQENQDQEVKDGYYRRLICNYILFAFCCLLPGGIMYLVLTTANYSLLLTNANYLLLLTTNYCPITLLTANYY